MFSDRYTRNNNRKSERLLRELQSAGGADFQRILLAMEKEFGYGSCDIEGRRMEQSFERR
jgi:hypothetical protein